MFAAINPITYKWFFSLGCCLNGDVATTTTVQEFGIHLPTNASALDKSLQVLPSKCVSNPNNISSTDLDQFNQTLYNLMESLVTQALGSSSIKYFAAGDKSFSSSRNANVYGLVQCTPDLSQMDCRSCLEGAVADISSCSGGKEGGRVLIPSCIAWYEVFQFYDSTSVPSSPTTPVIPPTSDNYSPTKTRRENSSIYRLIVFVVVPIAGLMTIITLAWAILQKKKPKQNVDNDDAMKRLEALKFNFSTIKAATNNFSNANKLGEGGFGSVYKARLPNGQEFAVKRLFHKTEHTEEQFENEILLVAKLQHKCLVSLQGFCSKGRERILIYELVGNGSLDQFIYEYISHGHYSVKSDVFSFGILVLEIVSGKKKSWLCNTDDVELLLSYAWTNWREGTASNLIDQILGDSSRSEIMRCIHIGLLCVQENVAYRPTMASVVQMLSSHCSSLPTPARPAFLIYSDIERDITLPASTSGASESEQSKDRDGTTYLLVH